MSVELSPRVLELISSRICHDLVSPVGAISNGVELMEELGESAGGEAISLIASSAEQASIRLKCFRLAYGAAGTDKNLGFKDIIEVFNDWIIAAHIKAEFAEDLALKFSMPPKGFLKTLLNLLILTVECSRGDGKIIVSVNEDGNGVKIETTGSNVSFRDGSEDALKGTTSPEDLDARSVHGYLTGKFAEYFGFKISHNLDKDSKKLEINLSF